MKPRLFCGLLQNITNMKNSIFPCNTGKFYQKGEEHMMHRTKVTAVIIGLLLTASTALAANVNPTVKTFTVPTSAVSPIPVSAFTATDTDGTVVGYLITESSTKPSATASGWSTTPLTSYTTAKTGAVTLYAWAKDNAAGVSAAKTGTTTIVSGHTHNQSDVVGLAASLAAKADVSALAAKADVSALTAKADVTHNHDSLYQQKYANLIVVAKSGGDFTDPVSAVNSIVDASETNTYLVKIMPGTYDIGSNILFMRANVDIEGSGQNVTTIKGSYSASDYNSGLVYSISDSEIRSLSIESTGNITFFSYKSAPKITNVNVLSTGLGEPRAFQLMYGAPVLKNVNAEVVVNGGSSLGYVIYDRDNTPSFENVNIKCSGSGFVCTGFYHDGGGYNYAPRLNNVSVSSESPNIMNNFGIRTRYTQKAFFNNVTATASNGTTANYAMSIEANNTELRNVYATASGASALGIQLTGIGLRMEQSVIKGDMSVPATNGSVFVSSSRVEGNITKSGPLTCLNVYDANFTPVTCQ
jgi:hypothetical protein